MAKIKLKNFGPIKNGLNSNDGFIEIKQVTVFIGNQATGKSTIAKIYSTCAWLEKVLYSGNLKEGYVKSYNRFVKEFCAYQGLKEYFKDNTYIEYVGDFCSFIYSNKNLEIKKHKQSKENFYGLPKIMYVPAERNFLSLVDNPEKLKQLPKPLYTFLEEFEKAKRDNNEDIPLPINNISFEFQKQTKKSYIKGDGYKIALSQASSGIQSLLPVFLVSKYLIESLNKEEDSSTQALSIEAYTRIKKELEKIIANKNLSSDLKDVALNLLSSKYKNTYFINIVEELEQNLFPESQKTLLYSLLEFLNQNEKNQLVLTTHSPYIINYLSLSIKGKMVLNLIKDNPNLKEKFKNILPLQACIDGANVSIYELDTQGNITILSTYKNIPSDENYLNHFIENTNTDFNMLLDIEEEL